MDNPSVPKTSRLALALAQLTPQQLLRASIVVALVTIVLKTLAWWVTGSVGLLSDALESLVNLASAVFALAMVAVAHRPPDDDHPFGHHKAEYFSSGFEGILIIVAALAIAWAAILRFWSPQPLHQVGWGLVLSVISSVLNGVLAWAMFEAARQHRSVALRADAKHLVTDVWTSAGVVIGVAGVSATGWLWLDPLVALGVALNIVREGVALVWQAARGLMDEALEPAVLAQINATLSAFEQAAAPGQAVRFDHIATRRAGAGRFVDFHMHVPGQWTLAHAADLREQVQRALVGQVPGLRVSIQMLPQGVEP